MDASFPGVCVVEAFHSSFFVLQLQERKLHFDFIVSCGVVYQLYVLKFMNASFPGVRCLCISWLLLFFVLQLLDYKIAFWFYSIIQ